jgi:hypothetical protein
MTSAGGAARARDGSSSEAPSDDRKTSAKATPRMTQG